MAEFPIVCHSGFLPENGVAADDTFHWWIESLHLGRDEKWHRGKAFFSKNYLKTVNTIDRSSRIANVTHFLFVFRNVRLNRRNLIHSATQGPGVPSLFGFIPTRKRSGAWDPFPAERRESKLFPKEHREWSKNWNALKRRNVRLSQSPAAVSLSQVSDNSLFGGFNPAVSPSAMKAMRKATRDLNLRRQTQLSLQDIARTLNPLLRGWIAYYGRYAPAALYPLLRYVNQALVVWAKRKFKRFKRHTIPASQFLQRLATECVDLFVHWQIGNACCVCLMGGDESRDSCRVLREARGAIPRAYSPSPPAFFGPQATKAAQLRIGELVLDLKKAEDRLTNTELLRHSNEDIRVLLAFIKSKRLQPPKIQSEFIQLSGM